MQSQPPSPKASAQHTSDEMVVAIHLLKQSLRALRSIEFGNHQPDTARDAADAIYMSLTHGALRDANSAVSKATEHAA